MPCAAKLHRLSDGFDVIRQIEARMFQPYNPCMLLTDRQYKKALGGDPVLHGDYRYILSDPDGTPCAYVYFTAQSHQGQTIAAVDALAYTHLSALQRTLGFLYGLRAQYAYVELPLPMDADLLQMLPEPKRAEVCIVPHGMARLVHTQEALRRMRHPAGTGAYTVRVLDPICPFNEGTYTVSYENGCVSASRTQLQPDLIADVGTFTQLVLGTYALDSVLWKDSVSLLQNEQTLRAVFVPKPVYFPHHF